MAVIPPHVTAIFFCDGSSHCARARVWRGHAHYPSSKHDYAPFGNSKNTYTPESRNDRVLCSLHVRVVLLGSIGRGGNTNKVQLSSCVSLPQGTAHVLFRPTAYSISSTVAVPTSTSPHRITIIYPRIPSSSHLPPEPRHILTSRTQGGHQESLRA